MSLTASELGVVVAALRADLIGARCGDVRDVAAEPAALALELSAPSGTGWLLVSATPGATRVHRISGRPPAPPHPSAFVMLLRKRLGGARLWALDAAAGDRAIALRFERAGCATSVGARLFGPTPVIACADEHGVVLAVARHGGELVGRPWPGGSARGDGGGLREGWPAREVDVFLEREYAAWLSGEHGRERRRAAAAALDGAIRRVDRRIRAVERDLERIDAAGGLRREAELLSAAYRPLDRGATELIVPDWYAEGQPPVRIALDPSRSLRENIELRFKEARRMQRGAGVALARLDAAQRSRSVLAALRADVAGADDDVLARIEAHPELRRASGSPAARGLPVACPYWVFTSRTGRAIWVGRSARDNDALTFRVARGNDVWLHAADWPGSHVIVPVRGGAPDAVTLDDAAQLAAHFSRGRADSVVGVHVTERKHVRKPKGAPAGRVSAAGVRTLEVRPDPERVAALDRARRDAP